MAQNLSFLANLRLKQICVLRCWARRRNEEEEDEAAERGDAKEVSLSLRREPCKNETLRAPNLMHFKR
mgnify:CR=1 FL=1